MQFLSGLPRWNGRRGAVLTMLGVIAFGSALQVSTARADDAYADTSGACPNGALLLSANIGSTNPPLAQLRVYASYMQIADGRYLTDYCEVVTTPSSQTPTTAPVAIAAFLQATHNKTWQEVATTDAASTTQAINITTAYCVVPHAVVFIDNLHASRYDSQQPLCSPHASSETAPTNAAYTVNGLPSFLDTGGSCGGNLRAEQPLYAGNSSSGTPVAMLRVYNDLTDNTTGYNASPYANPMYNYNNGSQPTVNPDPTTGYILANGDVTPGTVQNANAPTVTNNNTAAVNNTMTSAVGTAVQNPINYCAIVVPRAGLVLPVAIAMIVPSSGGQFNASSDAGLNAAGTSATVASNGPVTAQATVLLPDATISNTTLTVS